MSAKISEILGCTAHLVVSRPEEIRVARLAPRGLVPLPVRCVAQKPCAVLRHSLAAPRAPSPFPLYSRLYIHALKVRTPQTEFQVRLVVLWTLGKAGTLF